MAESVIKIGPEAPKENRIGLKATDYHGGKSTLCAACGHDAISNQIVRAFFERSRWLYVDAKELEQADATLDRQIAISSGMVDDLESDEKPTFSLGMEEYRKRWKLRSQKARGGR